MELVSLYYFTELAKDLHMTRTAERLYISQQTLSNHIARLESYYGAPLLYRKPALSLTPAGEYVLSSAKTIINEEANLKAILSDVETFHGEQSIPYDVFRKTLLSNLSSFFHDKTPP